MRRRRYCQQRQEKIQHVSFITKKPEVILKLNTPILNKFSIFDTPEGRLGGLCGGNGRVETCSFFGLVKGDQGAMGRPKSSLDRRFSLVEVACANRAGISAGHDNVLCWHGMCVSATSLVSLCRLSLLYCPIVGGRESEDETLTWVR